MYNSTKTNQLSWEFINQFSFHNPPEMNIKRSPEVEKKYSDTSVRKHFNFLTNMPVEFAV